MKLDLALAMGTFGFVVALGVFAFNIVEFKATRRDLARHEERMAKMMTEHGKILSSIRDSMISKKMGK